MNVSACSIADTYFWLKVREDRDKQKLRPPSFLKTCVFQNLARVKK